MLLSSMKCPIRNGSACETWLGARTKPPSGRFSMPCQSRLVVIIRIGRMKNLMTLIVNGTGRFTMVASLNLRGRTRVTAMQGTVASFDQSTRAGSLLTDDGMPLEFPAESLAEHIRHLRIGQRVFVETDGTGEVTSIKIWT